MTIFNPPPTWPPPPDGWQPPPGWRPDPSWPPPPPGWNFWVKPSRWQLDSLVAGADSELWTIRLGLLPIAAIVAVLAGEYLGLRGWHPHGAVRDTAFAIASILHYAAAVAVIVRYGRPLARQPGGWSAAFGLSWPRLRDAALGAAGAIAEFVARAIIAIVLLILIPTLRNGDPNNVNLHDRPTAELLTLVIVAVVIAPPIEELIFRGLLLRTLMRRYGFWPAALLSTGCFAILHLYEVSGIASQILLFASIFTFGLGQCLLVRWTGRLATSTIAHAVTNAAGFLLALAAHR